MRVTFTFDVIGFCTACVNISSNKVNVTLLKNFAECNHQKISSGFGWRVLNVAGPKRCLATSPMECTAVTVWYLTVSYLGRISRTFGNFLLMQLRCYNPENTCLHLVHSGSCMKKFTNPSLKIHFL